METCLVPCGFLCGSLCVKVHQKVVKKARVANQYSYIFNICTGKRASDATFPKTLFHRKGVFRCTMHRDHGPLCLINS